MFVNRDRDRQPRPGPTTGTARGASTAASASASRSPSRGFAARTETPGLTGREYAWNIDSEYDDGQTPASTFDYGVIGEDFNPEVGLSREHARLSALVRRASRRRCGRRRSGDWGFREFLPHINYTRYDYLDDGGLQSAELHVDNHWDWENGNFISTALNGTWDGLREPFEVYPGIIVPPGEHGGLRAHVAREHRSAQVAVRAASVGRRAHS